MKQLTKVELIAIQTVNDRLVGARQAFESAEAEYREVLTLCDLDPDIPWNIRADGSVEGPGAKPIIPDASLLERLHEIEDSD